MPEPRGRAASGHFLIETAKAMPSAKYSWSGSPLKFWNGITAIEGLSGSGSCGGKEPSAGIVRLATPAGSWQPAEHDDVAKPVSWLSLPARGHRACRVAVSLLQSQPA